MGSLSIKVNIDYSSIDKLQSKLDNLAKDKINIDVDLHTSSAMNKLSAFEDQYKQLKSTLEKGLDVKFNMKDAKIDSLFSDLKNNSKTVASALDVVTDKTKEMGRGVSESGGNFEKMVRTIRALDDNGIEELVSSMKEYDKATSSVSSKTEQMGNKTKSMYKDMSDSIQQYYKMQEKADSIQGKGGDNEANVIRKQAEALREKANIRMKDSGFLYKANAGQLQSLNTLEKELQVQREYSNQVRSAKAADRVNANNQKSNYSALKSELNEIAKLQSKISKLRAEKTEGSISGKNSIQLDALEKEYQLRKKNYEISKQSANQKGNISSSQNSALAALAKEKEMKQQSASISDEMSAKAKKTAQMYDEVAASISKVHSLNQKLSNSGDQEAAQIKKIIGLEEQKQDAILATAKTMDRANSERQQELSISKQQNAVERQQSDTLRTARKRDNLGNNSILGNWLNPQQIYNDAKQAGMAIYNSMAPVDKQLTNIAKVADAPQETLQKFGDTIYDTASQVGKSAEEYGVSVERWVTTGKTLSESVKMANTSVMGSFVGNIDEEAMVDYMSVPLNAYKDTALEATDVINAMNEVSNKNAIEMDDMGAAYKRAAATSAQAGTSFSELTGIITGAQEATRAGGEKIGTAVKAMDVNFGKIATKTTKGDVEKFNFFKDMGVDIKDSNGELRSTYDILGDLHGVWGKLSKDEQAQAGFYAAGKNFSNVFSGIMGNWDTVTKAAREAQGQLNLVDKESGSAFQEFSKQQDSMEFKAASLKNSWGKLISTIAGGRKGVTGVMDVMNSGLKTANKLAESDGFMKFAGGMAKVATVMTGATMANKFFDVISSGAMQSVTAVTNLVKAFAGMEKMKALGGAVSSIFPMLEGKGGALFGKMAAGGSKFLSIGSKIIPVVGGIAIGLTALDAMGVPVFETLGKGVKALTDNFNAGEKEVKAYAKAHKKAVQDFDKNPIVNGEMEQANKVIESYKQIRAEKEKTYKKSGKKGDLQYTPDEFQKIKKSFNDEAEALGFDVKITMNNFGDIEQKFRRLEQYKKALSEDKTTDLLDSMNKLSKYADTQDKTLESQLSKKHRQLEAMRAENKYLKEKGSLNKQEEAQLSRNNKLLQEAGRINSYKDGMYSTKAWKKQDAADAQGMKDFMKARTQLANSAKAGTLQEGFAKQDPKDQKQTLALLSSEIPLIDKKTDSYKSLYDQLKSGKAMTAEQQKDLISLDKTFADLGQDQNGAGWNKELRKGALDTAKKAMDDSKDSSKDLENSLRQLGETAGMSGKEIDGMINASKDGGQAFINMASDYGDVGAKMIGMTSRMKAEAEANGETWQSMASNIQQQIDKVPDEKVTKYKLEQENGVADFDMIDEVYNLPDEVVTEFELVDSSGNVNIQNTIDMLDQINENPKVTAELDVNDDGTVTLQEFSEAWGKLKEEDRNKITAEIDADDNATPKAKKAKESIDEVDGAKGKGKVDAEDYATKKAQKATSGIKGVSGTRGTGKIDASDAATPKAKKAKKSIQDVSGTKGEGHLDAKDTATQKANQARDAIVRFGGTPGTAHIDATDQATPKADRARQSISLIDGLMAMAGINADNSGAMNATNAAKAILASYNGSTASSVLRAVDMASGIIGSVISRLASVPSSKTITLTTIANKVTNFIEKHTKGSVAIENDGINPQMGRSFSASVGSQIAGKSANRAIGTSQSKSSKEKNNSRVDQDVWRYWSKELFKGLPIENSLDDLKRAIDKAGEDQNKLMSLYKKQISTLNKQIAYQKSLRSSQQSELRSVINGLKKYGFRAKGNQITNLGHAKSLKGEKAEKAEEKLNKYKELYESINSLSGSIKDLEQDKWQANQDIKQAKIDKELKSIEKSLKKTEALLTTIENNTNIQSTKEDLIGENDYELNLTVKEQGMNSAKENVSRLINEYNRLAKTSVAYGENAEEIQDKLSSLKDEILSNADAIIEYKEALNDIRIDRLISDFEKFSNVFSGNIDKMQNNIDNLKDGLISGTKLSDLQSSSLSNVDFTRKNKVEQYYYQRLQLESELDTALQAYAKKNVDRAKGVAAKTLQIERKKYNEMLKYQKQYSKGEAISKSTEKVRNGAGVSSAYDKDTTYKKWQDEMKKVTKSYTDEYNKMVKAYDKAMSKAKTPSERESLANKMVLDQLALQEKMYKSQIAMNNKLIAQAQKELKNTALTTEQRQTLLDTITEYEEANTDAQNAIKDTISSRYDFEFSLIDKAMDKASKYSSALQHLLDVAELVNLSPSKKKDLYDSIYEAKVNEYNKAKQALQQLEKEQKNLEAGSYEWNLLQEKIDDVRDSLNDLTVDALNANKDALSNALDAVQENLEKGLLGGKTLDEWKDYQDAWVDGISKELSLEKIRKRLLDIEDKTLDKRLEALDRQDKVSQKDLDYLDKQTKILELQDKLNNMEGERNVQTLSRNDDGTWAWDYVVDQTEYDKTKDELDDAKQDLDDYIKKQRQEYAEAYNNIIDKAKNGDYESTEDLRDAIANLQEIYKGILGQFPELDYSSIDELLAAYKEYLEANDIIVNDAMGSGDSASGKTDEILANIGSQFELAFTNISGELGKIIGQELRNALNEASSGDQNMSSYSVAIDSLNFPNVTDASDMEDLFNNLPNIVDQYVYKK